MKLFALVPIGILLALGGAATYGQTYGGTAATRLAIADTGAGGNATLETVIVVANRSSTNGIAEVSLQFDDGSTAKRKVTVEASAEVRLSIGEEFPEAHGRRFIASVASVGTPAAPLVVNWTSYARTLAEPPDASTAGVAGSLQPLRAARATSTVTGRPLEFAAAESATSSIAASGSATAIYNLKVVTDASPDLTDLDSLVHSTTSRWTSIPEKVWALFYWSHILKRQTSPMVLHGVELTDPIRNLIDYGFTMCSTISGINQSLYGRLGLRHQYWDLCTHTVAAVEYDGKFHMVDSSMSNLVTTADGVTLASVEEAAADGGRLVREHSVYSTSPNGFLTGSDQFRNLVAFANPADGTIVRGFANNFCTEGLKFRDYYYNWDSGHRYVLNLRENETYTRHYRRLGTGPAYWVGSENSSDPNPDNTYEIEPGDRFGMRGNGKWSFSPSLSADAWPRAVYRSTNIAAAGDGLRPSVPDALSEVVYKVQAANAITSQTIQARFARTDAAATAAIAVSVNHGLTWTQVAGLGTSAGSDVPVIASLRGEVSGRYETLVRIEMRTRGAVPDGLSLRAVTIETVTQVNTKALPRLNIGRNEITVGTGSQTDTMVLWPDLRGDLWRRDAYGWQNIASQPLSVPLPYTAVAYPAVLSQDAHLTYRMDAPGAITRIVYGGRLHNFRDGSYIDFLHSFDRGATWIRSYRLSEVSKPYDVVHHETVTDIPPGVNTVLFKFVVHNTNPDAERASGFYSLRMEASHRAAAEGPAPLDVTLRWKEVGADRTTVARSHRQRVSEFPFKYVVNAGGSDHPVMESIALSVANSSDTTPFGYGDGVDAGGQRYVPTKQLDGANLAKSRPYTFSRAPSGFQSSAGSTNTTVLTDGIVGAPSTGGMSYWWGQCWSAGTVVDLQVDLGAVRTARAFRAHLFGYPGWDALEGAVQDRIEVFTSTNQTDFVSQGMLQTSLWRKDVPINHMLLDNETATAWNFERRSAAPVSVRYVRYHITPERILCASELQVLDRVDYEPFDLRIAPPVFDALPSEPPTPPGISASPHSQTIASGQTATMNVAATGTPPLGYQWYVGSSGNTGNPIMGATSSAYTTPALSSTTTYWVRVSNGYGPPVNSATATIAIGTPPGIGTPPHSQTISSGLRATMNVVGTGTAPLSYQWYAGASGNTDSPVGGATADSYTTPALSNTTSYWVRVSNGYGSPADSPAARITVADPVNLGVFRPALGRWFNAGSPPVDWGAPGDLPVPGDYNGDGVRDLAVFRPSNGTWYVRDGVTVLWGAPGDIPVPADYNGDHVTDIAVFRPAAGLFYIRNVAVVAWGLSGDLPVVGDYNADGRADVAVYRPSTGQWFVKDVVTTVYGFAADIPVPADYDGDGAADIAVFRPSTGVWMIRDQYSQTWGQPGDVPIPLDRNGDGRAELGVFRRATGRWSFTNHLTDVSETWLWGAAGDIPLGRSLPVVQTAWGDYDGDRKADLTVFRPSTGDWVSLRSLSDNTDYTLRTWGLPGDVPVGRDFDGDGKLDPAVYRPSTGHWFVRQSATNSTYQSAGFGVSSDTPVPADYDGDGHADVAVFRPSLGQWLIHLSSTATPVQYGWGLSTDVAVPADYDGDGVTDLGVFRPSSGEWFIYNRITGAVTNEDWGRSGDIPAAADFDGDGKADLAVFRPALGRWFIRSSIDASYTVADWGLSEDLLVPADYDADGKADIAVFRPSNGMWYVRGLFNRSWGLPDDIPALKNP